MSKLFLALMLMASLAMSEEKVGPTELSKLESLGFDIQMFGHLVVDLDPKLECGYRFKLEFAGNNESIDRPFVRSVFLAVWDRSDLRQGYKEFINVEQRPFSRSLLISDVEDVFVSMVVEVMIEDEPKNILIDLSEAVREAQKDAVVPDDAIECSDVLLE